LKIGYPQNRVSSDSRNTNWSNLQNWKLLLLSKEA